jgi:hypothetical protein
LKVARTVFGWDVDPASNANSIKEIKDVLKILNAALKGK